MLMKRVQENFPLVNEKEAEAKTKNLLIDLVRRHALIYDKSHTVQFEPMLEMRSGIRSVQF